MTTQPATPEGHLLREARTAAGLTVREAAAAIGMSLKQWGETERGLSGGNPSPARTIAFMAGSLGITPDQLNAVGRADAAKILGAGLGPAPAESPGTTADIDALMEEFIERFDGAERDTMEFLWARLLDADGRLKPRDERFRAAMDYAREHRPRRDATG